MTGSTWPLYIVGGALVAMVVLLFIAFPIAVVLDGRDRRHRQQRDGGDLEEWIPYEAPLQPPLIEGGTYIGPKPVTAWRIPCIKEVHREAIEIDEKAIKVFTLALNEFGGYCARRPLEKALATYNRAARSDQRITQRNIVQLLKDYVYCPGGGRERRVSLPQGDYVLVQESPRKKRLITFGDFVDRYLVAADEEE